MDGRPARTTGEVVITRLAECALNISEGRDLACIDRICSAAGKTPGCHLLDVHSDWDHHRSVLTLVGEPDALLEGVHSASRCAVEWIDLRKHRGVHPRIGAVDVVPFIPLAGLTLNDCAVLARDFARRIAEELGLPVFLYEKASPGPEPLSLPQIRRGGLERLFGPVTSGAPRRRPDFGPEVPHETAGAVAVGAREILIAFNVLLSTPEAAVARSIARRIRESNGGLEAVRALGLYLESCNRAQISMNLTDYRRTSPLHAVEAIRREAGLQATGIAESELVGLAPRASLPPDPAAELFLSDFGSERILEVRVREEAGVELQL